MFSKLFNRDNNKGKNLTSMQESVEKRKMDITPFINDITTILQIDCPEIKSVACLYESNGLVQAQNEFRRNELPMDAQYYGAYYSNEQNLIILPRKYPVTSLEEQTIHFKNVTIAENIFSIAHELRHVWQNKFHEDTYYQNNALGMEIIDDIAEVDADAFALVFTFSDKTPFTAEDIPNILEEICLQATADGGKRWNRAKELSDEYGFGNFEKVEQVKSSANYDNINKYIILMKLNRMI